MFDACIFDTHLVHLSKLEKVDKVWMVKNALNVVVLACLAK